MSPRVKVQRSNGITEIVPVSKITTVTRGEHTSGVVELIICNNGVRGDVVTRRFDPEAEAAEVLDALYALPIETRRALFILISDFSDGFCNASQSRSKVKNWAKHEGRSR